MVVGGTKRREEEVEVAVFGGRSWRGWGRAKDVAGMSAEGELGLGAPGGCGGATTVGEAVVGAGGMGGAGVARDADPLEAAAAALWATLGFGRSDPRAKRFPRLPNSEPDVLGRGDADAHEVEVDSAAERAPPFAQSSSVRDHAEGRRGKSHSACGGQTAAAGRLGSLSEGRCRGVRESVARDEERGRAMW